LLRFARNETANGCHCEERSDEAICAGLKLLVQIAPFGIKPVDEIDPLPAGAGFDLLLASDRAGRAMTPDPVIAGSGARRNLCEIASLRSR